jgi:hypothetical protein
MEKYTTTDKIAAADKISLDMGKIEKAKTVISNDAYSICDLINSLIDKLEHARASMIK